MKIFLTDQSNHFEDHLKTLIGKPTMAFDKRMLTEKVSAIDINVDTDFQHLDLSFLFDYKIFPAHIISSLAEWTLEGREMKVGDTILQQAFLPPLKVLSQKIIFGVRVNNIIKDASRKGFSYETIEGHAEKGESTFTIEKTDNGILFKITTFSAPGTYLSKLVGPIFTSPYQAYCTRKALANVKHQLERNNVLFSERHDE
jgi:hypothetical protein